MRAWIWQLVILLCACASTSVWAAEFGGRTQKRRASVSPISEGIKSSKNIIDSKLEGEIVKGKGHISPNVVGFQSLSGDSAKTDSVTPSTLSDFSLGSKSGAGFFAIGTPVIVSAPDLVRTTSSTGSAGGSALLGAADVSGLSNTAAGTTVSSSSSHSATTSSVSVSRSFARGVSANVPDNQKSSGISDSLDTTSTPGNNIISTIGRSVTSANDDSSSLPTHIGASTASSSAGTLHSASLTDTTSQTGAASSETSSTTVVIGSSVTDPSLANANERSDILPQRDGAKALGVTKAVDEFDSSRTSGKVNIDSSRSTSISPSTLKTLAEEFAASGSANTLHSASSTGSTSQTGAASSESSSTTVAIGSPVAAPSLASTNERSETSDILLQKDGAKVLGATKSIEGFDSFQSGASTALSSAGTLHIESSSDTKSQTGAAASESSSTTVAIGSPVTAPSLSSTTERIETSDTSPQRDVKVLAATDVVRNVDSSHTSSEADSSRSTIVAGIPRSFQLRDQTREASVSELAGHTGGSTSSGSVGTGSTGFSVFVGPAETAASDPGSSGFQSSASAVKHLNRAESASSTAGTTSGFVSQVGGSGSSESEKADHDSSISVSHPGSVVPFGSSESEKAIRDHDSSISVSHPGSVVPSVITTISRTTGSSDFTNHAGEASAFTSTGVNGDISLSSLAGSTGDTIVKTTSSATTGDAGGSVNRIGSAKASLPSGSTFSAKNFGVSGAVSHTGGANGFGTGVEHIPDFIEKSSSARSSSGTERTGSIGLAHQTGGFGSAKFSSATEGTGPIDLVHQTGSFGSARSSSGAEHTTTIDSVSQSGGDDLSKTVTASEGSGPTLTGFNTGNRVSTSFSTIRDSKFTGSVESNRETTSDSTIDVVGLGFVGSSGATESTDPVVTQIATTDPSSPLVVIGSGNIGGSGSLSTTADSSFSGSVENIGGTSSSGSIESIVEIGTPVLVHQTGGAKVLSQSHTDGVSFSSPGSSAGNARDFGTANVPGTAIVPETASATTASDTKGKQFFNLVNQTRSSGASIFAGPTINQNSQSVSHSLDTSSSRSTDIASSGLLGDAEAASIPESVVSKGITGSSTLADHETGASTSESTNAIRGQGSSQFTPRSGIASASGFARAGGGHRFSISTDQSEGSVVSGSTARGTSIPHFTINIVSGGNDTVKGEVSALVNQTESTVGSNNSGFSVIAEGQQSSGIVRQAGRATASRGGSDSLAIDHIESPGAFRSEITSESVGSSGFVDHTEATRSSKTAITSEGISSSSFESLTKGARDPESATPAVSHRSSSVVNKKGDSRLSGSIRATEGLISSQLTTTTKPASSRDVPSTGGPRFIDLIDQLEGSAASESARDTASSVSSSFFGGTSVVSIGSPVSVFTTRGHSFSGSVGKTGGSSEVVAGTRSSSLTPSTIDSRFAGVTENTGSGGRIGEHRFSGSVGRAGSRDPGTEQSTASTRSFNFTGATDVSGSTSAFGSIGSPVSIDVGQTGSPATSGSLLTTSNFVGGVTSSGSSSIAGKGRSSSSSSSSSSGNGNTHGTVNIGGNLGSSKFAPVRKTTSQTEHDTTSRSSTVSGNIGSSLLLQRVRGASTFGSSSSVVGTHSDGETGAKSSKSESTAGSAGSFGGQARVVSASGFASASKNVDSSQTEDTSASGSVGGVVPSHFGGPVEVISSLGSGDTKGQRVSTFTGIAGSGTSKLAAGTKRTGSSQSAAVVGDTGSFQSAVTESSSISRSAALHGASTSSQLADQSVGTGASGSTVGTSHFETRTGIASASRPTPITGTHRFSIIGGLPGSDSVSGSASNLPGSSQSSELSRGTSHFETSTGIASASRPTPITGTHRFSIIGGLSGSGSVSGSASNLPGSSQSSELSRGASSSGSAGATESARSHFVLGSSTSESASALGDTVVIVDASNSKSSGAVRDRSSTDSIGLPVVLTPGRTSSKISTDSHFVANTSPSGSTSAAGGSGASSTTSFGSSRVVGQEGGSSASKFIATSEGSSSLIGQRVDGSRTANAAGRRTFQSVGQLATSAVSGTSGSSHFADQTGVTRDSVSSTIAGSDPSSQFRGQTLSTASRSGSATDSADSSQFANKAGRTRTSESASTVGTDSLRITSNLASGAVVGTSSPGIAGNLAGSLVPIGSSAISGDSGLGSSSFALPIIVNTGGLSISTHALDHGVVTTWSAFGPDAVNSFLLTSPRSLGIGSNGQGHVANKPPVLHPLGAGTAAGGRKNR